MPDSEAADCLYADIYAYIEQGLCYDEINDQENAKAMYEKGLQLMSEPALKIGNSSSGADNSRNNGLLRVKKLVEERINSIGNGNKVDAETNNERISEIRDNLNFVGNSAASHDGAEEAELYYWLPENVQLIVIEGDKTNAPSPPSSLAIFKIKENQKRTAAEKQQDGQQHALPAAFIQVGPWIYPLFPGISTILKNEFGIYVVPNPTQQHPNMFVGIILPPNIEPRLEEEFVFALKQFSTLKLSASADKLSFEEKQRISERISQLLIRTGEYLAQNTQNISNMTGKFMAEKGEQYRVNMEPTTEPININPVIRHSVFVLHKGSKVVARVTRTVLDKIGDVGVALGQKLASSVGTDSSGGRMFQDAITVIGGGITAFSTVWIALEDASKTLMRNLATETVQTVQLRYGDEASQTAHHALHAVGHTTLAGFQLYELGPRSIAGRMARKAGLQFVRDVYPTTNEAAAAVVTVPVKNN